VKIFANNLKSIKIDINLGESITTSFNSLADPSLETLYPIQSYYLFEAKGPDKVAAFEQVTGLRVNRQDLVVVPVSSLPKVSESPKKVKHSWIDSFWDSGWSNVTFGTVATVAGIGLLCLASGPFGIVSGILAVAGGSVGALSGGAQLLSNDPRRKQFFADLGNASLALDNIPGLIAGTTTYVITGDVSRTVDYANVAGLVGGVTSLARGGVKAIKVQRLYNLEVGAFSTKWSRRTRRINAMIMGIDPTGLEGSHLVPQRIFSPFVQRLPMRLQRPFENLFNGPLGVNFIPAMEHALYDSYRFQTLPKAGKEALSAAHPIRAALLQHSPQVADVFGFAPNMSPVVRPIANSLVITTGRAAKAASANTSEKK